MSKDTGGAAEISAEEKQRIREEARAELLREQEDDRREQARIEEEKKAEALKRSNAILGSEAAKERPEAAKQLVADAEKFPTAEHALATLEMLPVETGKSDFQRGVEDKANHNADVPEGSQQTGENNNGFQPEDQSLYARLKQCGYSDEEATQAVHEARDYEREHGRQHVEPCNLGVAA